MSKIKINYTLKTKDEEIKLSTKGIKQNNKITFKDNDIMFSIINLDDYFILQRTNKEYTLELKFNDKKSIGIYSINGLGDIYLDVKKINLSIKDNEIKLKYMLNEELFELELNYEVIEW